MADDVARPPSETPLRVLIIDDEPGLRDMLVYGLQKRGYTVVCAANGDEALVQARAATFDLAVCDVMMPGKSGVDVLPILKEIQPNLEVIMATGFATLETAVDSMKKGAFDYITKPYSLGHLCAVFDKALEHRALKAKIDHLEELNRLKSDFMATMSHELRTPMASVLGYVSLVLQGVYGEISDRQSKALLRAEVNARNLLQLINNILDFSKLSSDRMVLFPEIFSANEVVTETIEALEPLALGKSITLEAKISGPLWLRTDKTKFKQILINLIGNAIKFTHKGGVTAYVRPLLDPDFVEVTVADTGIGIAEEHIPELFQEFKQLDSSTTREYGGTGLGLAITKRLCELIGGKIHVTSTVGSGSRFSVELPVRTERPLTVETLPESEAFVRAPNEKIIVAIDDDPDILKVLSDNLRQSGCRVMAAQSGEEGIALARKIKPDMITLDIMMPHMDGWSVLQVIKNDPELRTIPVYVVSIVDNKALALSLGVSGYIMKPFTRQDLLEKLELLPRNKVRHVLVVDDDPIVRSVVAETLDPKAYDVQAVGTGEEALEHVNRLRPDILFLDLTLPGISGFEVLQGLESRASSEKTLVFVMTDKELTEQEQTFLNSRVETILRKSDTSLQELMARLKTHLTITAKAA